MIGCSHSVGWPCFLENSQMAKESTPQRKLRNEISWTMRFPRSFFAYWMKFSPVQIPYRFKGSSWTQTTSPNCTERGLDFFFFPISTLTSADHDELSFMNIALYIKLLLQVGWRESVGYALSRYLFQYLCHSGFRCLGLQCFYSFIERSADSVHRRLEILCLLICLRFIIH